MADPQIPFLDLKRVLSFQRDALVEAATRVIDGGMFVLGENLAAFETRFARLCGVDAVIGVGNGLDALRLTLRAAIDGGRLARGDEVILPAHTFIATALAVSDCGLVPVFADCDPHTALAGVAEFDACRTPRTRAAIAVHLYGQLCEMPALQAWCAQHELLLFEDAAQAHGASLDGLQPGRFGLAAAYSFFPTKNLGALGDAGGVATCDPALAEQVRRLRNYGSTEKYIHTERGLNSRLDELQAALLLVRLQRFEAELAERRRLAARYRDGLRHPLLQPLALRTDKPESHAWHLFVVRSPRRDALQAWLAGHGIGSQIHYPRPIHRQDAYRDTATRPLPHTEALCGEILSLPLFPGLTDAEQDRVIEACNAFPGQAG
jgi:dTDP-4-amino-4,6-dideoxygalactose transaminase